MDENGNRCYHDGVVSPDAPNWKNPTLFVAPVVYVVDDEPLALNGLCRLLRSVGREVQAFDSPESFLHAARGDMGGCLLLDVQMPVLNGLDLQVRLVAAGCHLPIIFLTGHGDVAMSVRAMKAGAVDFLIKPVQEKDLFEAIERALERDARERGLRRKLSEISQKIAALTPREHEVFALVVTGMLNKQIADRIGTTEKTVKVHRGRVMSKMSARSLADLVRMAGRLGVPAQVAQGNP